MSVLEEHQDVITTVLILMEAIIRVLFHLDIDECTRGTSGCDHNCTNTDGSYYCTCMDGYELKSDNHTCIGDDYVYVYVHKYDQNLKFKW